MRLRDGLANEPLRRGRIPPRSQKEIDRLPSAVHRPIEIRPASLHPDVGFVHPPGAIAHSQMRADSLFKLRCVGLDPSEDRRVVDLDAAIEQHELQITVADGNIRYHRTAQRITSAVNWRPLKQLPRPIPMPARSFPTQSYRNSVSSEVCNRTGWGMIMPPLAAHSPNWRASSTGTEMPDVSKAKSGARAM